MAVVERVFAPIRKVVLPVALPATVTLSALFARGDVNHELATSTQEPSITPIARSFSEEIPAIQRYSVAPAPPESPITEQLPSTTMQSESTLTLPPIPKPTSTVDPAVEVKTIDIKDTIVEPLFNFEGFVLYETDSCDLDAWEPLDRATFVEIPAINFAEPVQLAEQVPIAQDSNDEVLVTPPEGIATPKKVISNVIHVYGHSFVGSERQPFADIEKLEEGNLIKVTDEDNELTCFEVSEFALVNKESPRTLRGPSDKPRVIGQTSFIYKGIILLNEESVLKKVGENKPEDISGGAAFFVIAEPVGETEGEAP